MHSSCLRVRETNQVILTCRERSAFLTLNPCISSSRATHRREGSAGTSPRQNWITDRPTTKKVEVQQKQVCLTCSGRWEGCGMRRHRCRCCCCCMASGAGAPQRCCCCCSFGRRENGMQKVIERERESKRCTREELLLLRSGGQPIY